MIATFKKYIKKQLFPQPVREREVVDAYDIWAENYDAQPGNLMLDLDGQLFPQLLANIDIKNKHLADIGCGTGRYWAKILSGNPAGLTGFDVSPGMLYKLQEKFPGAKTHIIIDNTFSAVPDGTYDVIVSTLTVAHIEDIEQALDAWQRILKDKGDIIITDFHPDVLAFGGKRTFRHRDTHIAVKNFIHPVDVISDLLIKHGFELVCLQEKKVDETVKHYYTEQHAEHVYRKFEGFNVIYGIHFRRP